MTTEHRQSEHRRTIEERDKLICDFYTQGHSQAECANRFGLKRQRIQQILKRGGAWRPHGPSGRTKYVGVVVSPKTKEGLEEKAEEQGVSVSKLASDALDALVKGPAA